MRFCWAQYGLWAVIAVLGLLALSSGCGAKGELFLPEEPRVVKESSQPSTNALPPSR